MKPLLSLLSKSRSIIALKILFQQASRFFLHFLSTQISLYCYFSSSLLTALCFLLFFVPLPLLSSFFVSVFLFFLTFFLGVVGLRVLIEGLKYSRVPLIWLDDTLEHGEQIPTFGLSPNYPSIKIEASKVASITCIPCVCRVILAWLDNAFRVEGYKFFS